MAGTRLELRNSSTSKNCQVENKGISAISLLHVSAKPAEYVASWNMMFLEFPNMTVNVLA